MEKKSRRNKARPLWKLAVAGGIVLLGIGLLTESEAVSRGIRTGLEVCGGVLIPSLFPFMVLSGFISLSGYAGILSAPLRPITTRLYKLPGELGVVILLSMIGGYPVGAKTIATLLEQGRVDRATAERMLCFCVNSGPSFLITAVGTGLFFDKTAGVILFATQTFATLVIGMVVSARIPYKESASTNGKGMSGSSAFVAAVSGACSAMIAMCSFAILFSGLLSLITASGAASWIASQLHLQEDLVVALVSGFFEVTTGCIAAAKLGGDLAFAMVSLFVSFSGLSVLFQIMSCFGDAPVRFRPLVLSRVAHAGISTILALPLYHKFCVKLPVWLSVTPPLARQDSRTVLISVCLLAMCAIFSLSLCDTHWINRRR